MIDKKCKKIGYFYGFIMLVYTFSEGLFGYGFTAFMHSRGISLAYIGIIMGITDLFTTFFDYPSGNIADKYGRKKICGIGFIIYGLGFFYFGTAHSQNLFLVSGVVRALGIALISGAPSGWFVGELNKYDAFKYKDKILPALRGLSLLIGSLSGIVAGNISVINNSYPVYIGGIILVISGFIILFLFEDNKGNAGKEDIWRLLIKNTISFAKDSSMRILALFEILKTVMFMIFILSWQVFALDVIGLSTLHLGYLYTIMLLLMSFSSFLQIFY